jgi:hypothetical protein
MCPKVSSLPSSSGLLENKILFLADFGGVIFTLLGTVSTTEGSIHNFQKLTMHRFF